MENNKEYKSSLTDRLANERTFLAWIRTGLGIVALGFVIMKFSLFISQLAAFSHNFQGDTNQYSNLIKQPLADGTGLIMMFFGCLLMILSYFRYRLADRQLEKGNYVVLQFLPLITTIGLVLMVLILIIYFLISM